MNGGWVAFLILCLVSAGANAQHAQADTSCPISAAASPASYSRLHQIPTTAAHNDVSHTVVTPGGMVLHTPDMVAATDVLTVTARDPEAMCFHLLTFAKERRKCEIVGVAKKETESSYLFNDGNAAVRFTFMDADEVEVAPIGTAYRSQCEPSGSIERATYILGGVQGR
jgi:hypothetical protein